MHELEALQARRFLSGDVFHFTSTGTLVVTGTDAGDRISVYLKGGKRSFGVIATLESVNRGAEVTSVSYTFNGKYFTVKRIHVDGGAGDDEIFVSGGAEMTRPATLLGGAGATSLTVPSAALR